MRNTRIVKLLAALGLMIVTTWAWADAPVVNLDQMGESGDSGSDQAVVVPMQPPLTMEQRVKQLEQQQSNLTQMNLPAQLDELHQQLQQLRGQIEEQAHTIQTLQTQLNSFYQDVNQRLTAAPSSNNATSNTALADNKAANANNTPPPSTSSNEQTAYQKALNLLSSKKYGQALQALQDYLQRYPSGQYVVNSNYWLGEIYFLQNKFTQAGQAFQTMISKAPNDPKVPDAKFKLALIHDNAGQHDQARKELKQIIQNHPNSSAARLAKLRLQALSSDTTAPKEKGVSP